MTSKDGISISGVSKSFGDSLILNDVSFECPQGQITAFLGPNGAGKTTTLRIAAGLSRPDAGQVRFGGQLLRDMAVPGQQVGFSLDASAFHPGRSVRETIYLTAIACGLKKASAHSMLERVGLESVVRRRVGHLSLGMRQRLAIGCALLPNPRYLVLDEPVNGLDVEGVMWIRETLQQRAEAGGTILLSSHLLREVQAVADRIVLLDRGLVVADARPQDLVDRSWSVASTVMPDRLEALLTGQEIHFERHGDDFTASCSPETLGRLTAEHRIALTRLDTGEDSDLERTFLRLTTGEFAVQDVERDQHADTP